MFPNGDWCFWINIFFLIMSCPMLPIHGANIFFLGLVVVSCNFRSVFFFLNKHWTFSKLCTASNWVLFPDHIQDRPGGTHNTATHLHPAHPIFDCHVHHGHMAVLCAPIHAPEQVPVPTHPLEAPFPDSPICNWGSLQPPSGRPSIRHCRWGPLLFGLWHDGPYCCLFLLLCSDQNGRRSLRPLAAGEYLSLVLSE